MNALLSISVEAGSGWVEYWSLLFSFLTTLIAFFALYTWRIEKDYSFRIEALSRSRFAIGLIDHLRYMIPMQNDKLDEEAKKRFFLANNGAPLTPAQITTICFQSRVENNKALFQEILELKEKAATYFGESSAIYRFYHFVSEAIFDIRDAHTDLVAYSDETKFPEKEFIEIRKKATELVCPVDRENNEISTKLRNLRSEMMRERRRFKILGF